MVTVGDVDLEIKWLTSDQTWNYSMQQFIPFCRIPICWVSECHIFTVKLQKRQYLVSLPLVSLTSRKHMQNCFSISFSSASTGCHDLQRFKGNEIWSCGFFFKACKFCLESVVVAAKANYLVVRLQKELYILNRWRIGIKWAFFLGRKKANALLGLW